MMEAIKYALMFIGGTAVILFFVGIVVTAFHSQPVTDYVEEALEEVTRKRGRKK